MLKFQFLPILRHEKKICDFQVAKIKFLVTFKSRLKKIWWLSKLKIKIFGDFQHPK